MYLNEFINFDELKQSFAMFMRFYAYNPHVYSDSLVKTLIICNQHFLNTYKNVHELVRQAQVREQERVLATSGRGRGGSGRGGGSNTAAGGGSGAENVSDTNATKNSSTASSFAAIAADPYHNSMSSVKKIYDLYANTDTSFILKKVLATFEHNDPVLNRSCVDFLDGLMIECSRHEKLFHMNLALSLANITLLESFRFLDQRIKDLISAILVEIRCMCKRKPRLANKILFDVQHHDYSSTTNGTHHNKTNTNHQAKKRKQIDEISPTSNKRIRIGNSIV